MSLHFLLALAQAAAEPPRTVNDGVLGKAEDFATEGPSRVCVGRTSIDLVEGEKAYLDYLGIHWGGIRVVGPKVSFLVKDGDSWAEPRLRDLFEDEDGRKIARIRRDGAYAYLIYGPGYSPSDKDRPSTWVSGNALKRSGRDSVLRRVKISDGLPRGCARSFEYGWDFLLGDAEEEADQE